MLVIFVVFSVRYKSASRNDYCWVEAFCELKWPQKRFRF